MTNVLLIKELLVMSDGKNLANRTKMCCNCYVTGRKDIYKMVELRFYIMLGKNIPKSTDRH